MLTITIPEMEWFDENTQEFSYTKSVTLQLEHSLISISKWEAKWKRPFLDDRPKTFEENIDYVRCMTINKVDPRVYSGINSEIFKTINNYINDSHTATWFTENKKDEKSSEKTTSELIYYWMIANNIPVEECQKWHLNRLLTLIRICSIKNQPAKKMSKKDIMKQNTKINEERLKKYHTTG